MSISLTHGASVVKAPTPPKAEQVVDPAKGIAVVLSKTELLQGGICGIRRRTESIRQNLRGSKVSDSGWGADVEGALAEMAFCKATGVYWEPTVNTFKAPDVGDLIQIRGTSYQEGRLIVRSGDDPFHIFVLVTIYRDHFRVVGWMFGHEAKKPLYIANPNARGADCYMVPQNDLHDVSTLPEEGFYVTATRSTADDLGIDEGPDCAAGGDTVGPPPTGPKPKRKAAPLRKEPCD